MAFLAVDACALYPFSLRDTLLRLAARELYDVKWSDEILDEMRRNLVENHAAPLESAQGLVDAMVRHFPDAAVPADAIERLIPAMTNAEDRHVLAAAQAGGAEVVVTFNFDDFAEESTAPLGIDAVHPDEFLQILFAISPPAVLEELRVQASDLKNPPFTFEELLESLERHVPEFVQSVRAFALEQS